DSRYFTQGCKRTRLETRQRIERSIVHHHERGHGLALGLLPSPLAKSRENLGIHRELRCSRDSAPSRRSIGGRYCRSLARGEPIQFHTADVAGSAGFPFRSLAKVEADLAMAAARGFDEAAHGVIALPGALFLRGILGLL